ncbi:UDP-glucuronosyltransferase 1-6-like [Sceloporus undulatus]|uniref:UDP-glucuronosyltransferase 1-6-like n=1 Tax=Sceloporus undulatus TaxID=8520 RepID=UPI001C4DD24A|nr:UDP-glucuronosyltransferase 1-6-like [Sceloporus undulatus]
MMSLGIASTMMACLKSRSHIAVWITFLLSLWHSAESGKLLVVPQDGSHWLSMEMVIEKLAQRGHEIVVLIPENNLLMRTSEHFIVKTHSVPYSQEELDQFYRSIGEAVFDDSPFLEKIFEMHTNISRNSGIFASICRNLLYDKELVTFLQQSKFDAMFSDPVLPCGPILAEYLSLPTVYFLRGLPCSLDYQAAQCPVPLSYIPQMFTSFSDHMSFTERVKNFLVTPLDLYICSLFFENHEHLASEFLQRKTTVLELFSKTSIWLLRYDFVFEYPRPVMPNMFYIGGINCAQKKPLSKVT